jgi:hypothetical protein
MHRVPLGVAVPLVAVPLIVSLLGGSLARADAPSPSDVELAKAHYNTGELEYVQGAYASAAREFAEAYRLTSAPELLFNMGKAYEGAHDLAKALSAYRRFLAAVKQSPDRELVQRRVNELGLMVGRLSIQANVAGATVTLDGEAVGATPLPDAPLEVTPGRHALSVAAEGYRTFRQEIDVPLSGDTRVEARLDEQVRVVRVAAAERRVPVYRRWWLWTAVGVVVAAGVVTGAVLGARAGGVDGPSAQLPAL